MSVKVSGSTINEENDQLVREIVNIDVEIERVRWEQNKAKFALASHRAHQGVYYDKMKQHQDEVKILRDENNSHSSTVKKTEEILTELLRKRKELEILKNEIANLDIQSVEFEKKHLIDKNKNKAKFVRLGKQIQEAEFRRQEAQKKCILLGKLQTTDKYKNN